MTRGAGWMVAFRLAERSLGLISTLVLVRLLSPADFGLVAMAMTVVALVELMGAFGFDAALIQAATVGRSKLDTVFTMNLLLALAAGGFIVLLAWPAAAFYADPRLVPLMVALGLASSVQGLENPGTVAFRRDMNFGREFQFLVAKKTVAFVFTLASAWLLRSYWALVIGILAGRVAGVGLSYLMHPYRPRLCLSERAEIMSFSVWMLVNNVLQFANGRFSHLIIGRAAGASTLGIFTVASEIATLPTSELLAPVNRALFPGLARLAADMPAFRRSLLNVISGSTLVVVPAAFGLAAVAEPLVRVALSAKWNNAIPVIQILAFSGGATALISAAYPAYLALGRPRIATALLAIKVAITLPAMAFGGFNYGLMGIVWAELLTAVAFLPISLWTLRSTTHVALRDIAERVWRPLVAGTLMYLAVSAYVHGRGDNFPEMPDFLLLATAVMLGGVLYVGTVALLWVASRRPEGAETTLRGILQSAIRRGGAIG